MPVHGRQGSMQYHAQVTTEGVEQLLHGRNTCFSSNAQTTINQVKDYSEKYQCLDQGYSGVLGTFYA
jgi:hypothetical protein